MRCRGIGRLLVAFGFGLFHGLGFAGGLLEAMAGLPGVAVATAIAAFSVCFVFSSRSRHTRCSRDWSSDVCSSDLGQCLVLGSWEAPVSDEGEALAAVEKLVEAGAGRRQAADVVARLTGQQHNRLYRDSRSEERRVGKECRSRWSPDH